MVAVEAVALQLDGMDAEAHRLAAALADRYRIVRELGRGGMATVYLAEDLKHGREVAIKVLRPELAESIGAGRFTREIRIASQLTHPNLVGLHDSGEVAGFVFYVMPFVDGESLRARVEREGALPVADASRILSDVAEAMEYAHAHGVVHRDLKPENVMLTGRHAVVMDFGVAKAVAAGRDAAEGVRTTDGVALGTPAYMSPEQASADPLVDHRSDIYTWGVIAYELLAGRTPFTHASPGRMMAAHVTTRPDALGTHRENLPEELERLVMQCLEKRPADRPGAALDLVRTLEGLRATGTSHPRLARGAAEATVALGSPSDASSGTSSGATRIARRFVVLTVLVAAVAGVGAVVRLAMERSSPVESARLLVMPVESDGAFPEAIAQVMRDLPTDVVREGVGDPVPAATLRDRVTARSDSARLDAAALAREMRAGLVLRTFCSAIATQVRCRLELLRMPQSLLRLTVSVEGRADDPTFASRLREQALVLLLLQARWGDRTRWEGVYLTPSLAAVRALHEAVQADAQRDLPAARAALARATLEDDVWVLPLLLASRGEPRSARDTLQSRIASRAGLDPHDRAFVDYLRARDRQDQEAAWVAVQRAHAIWPELHLFDLISSANITGRPRTIVDVSALLDSLPHLGAARSQSYRWVGLALHHLGRHRESQELARRYAALFPGDITSIRTLGIRAAAGRGDVAEVRRIIAESHGGVESSGNAGTRSVAAAVELMVHGQAEPARELLIDALPTYRRLRVEQGNSTWVDNELQALEWTDQLDAARALAESALTTDGRPAYRSCFLPASLGRIAARQSRRDEALRRDGDLARVVKEAELLPIGHADRDSLFALAGLCRYLRVGIAARLGDLAGAVQRLNESRGVPWSELSVYWYFHRDPDVAVPLAGYPPFEAMLRPKP